MLSSKSRRNCEAPSNARSFAMQRSGVRPSSAPRWPAFGGLFFWKNAALLLRPADRRGRDRVGVRGRSARDSRVPSSRGRRCRVVFRVRPLFPPVRVGSVTPNRCPYGCEPQGDRRLPCERERRSGGLLGLRLGMPRGASPKERAAPVGAARMLVAWLDALRCPTLSRGEGEQAEGTDAEENDACWLRHGGEGGRRRTRLLPKWLSTMVRSLMSTLPS